MNAQELLQEISDYCRQTGLAESTFGRRAVNDGKLASRLRHGGRITTETLDRIRGFMATNRNAGARPAVIARAQGPHDSTTARSPSSTAADRAADNHVPIHHTDRSASVPATAASGADPQRNFRFFDNRQKYLLFVNTCSREVGGGATASRSSLHNIHPRPPALRLFDAGVGDGTVLLRVMRAMHDRFPHTPFYVVGKEISLEDVRLDDAEDVGPLHRASGDRAGADQPRLCRRALARGEVAVSAASSMVWHEVALTGSSAHQFEQQITDLVPFLDENWKAGVSPKTGNPVYERPVVLVVYREDHKFLLDPIIPKPGGTRRQLRSGHRLAALPRARLARLQGQARHRAAAARARTGRAADRHPFARPRSRPRDHAEGLAGRESVHPRPPSDHEGGEARARARRARPQLQRLRRQPLAVPLRHAHAAERDHPGISIGTSTLFAAWNAAIYVAQVEDHRVAEAAADGRYLAATSEVLQKHGALWFFDESYVISRRRE